MNGPLERFWYWERRWKYIQFKDVGNVSVIDYPFIYWTFASARLAFADISAFQGGDKVDRC